MMSPYDDETASRTEVQEMIDAQFVNTTAMLLSSVCVSGGLF